MAPLLAMQPDFNSSDARIDAMWAGAQARVKAARAVREDQLVKEAIRAASF
jgi:hypothetical protein